MMNVLRKPGVYGLVAGVILLLVLDRSLNRLDRLRWLTPEPTLIWWKTSGLLLYTVLAESILGAITLSAAAIWKLGYRWKAKKVCIRGGMFMTLASLAPLICVLWTLIDTQVFVIGVPGPSNISWQVRLTFFALFFNTPLQWSILLILAGGWLPPSKPPLAEARLKVL